MCIVQKCLDMYPAAKIYHIWKGSRNEINGVIDVHLEMCVFLITANPFGHILCIVNSPSGKEWRICRNTDNVARMTAAYFL